MCAVCGSHWGQADGSAVQGSIKGPLSNSPDLIWQDAVPALCCPVLTPYDAVLAPHPLPLQLGQPFRPLLAHLHQARAH